MKNETKAAVTVRGAVSPALISITDKNKPAITDAVIQKWQNILDVLIKVFEVPSSLIMKIEENAIAVFLKGTHKDNPYEVSESAKLGEGLYCETVLGRDKPLVVQDALNDPVWRDNPDVKLKMISYLGFPIKWPDKTFFGTICILDNKANEYSKKFIDVMNVFKETIEQDLQLIIENKMLNDLDTLKTDFTNMMNHELRTPLVSMKGAAKLLLKGTAGLLNDKQAELVSIISVNTERQIRLVNEMLDMSRIEAGYYKIQPEKRNLAELVDEAAGTVIGQAVDRGNTIVKNIDLKKAEWNLDGDGFVHILSNLLSNALKFSPKGAQVVITVKDGDRKIMPVPEKEAEKIKKEGFMLLVSVKDTGIGISSADLPVIFDKYRQVGVNDSNIKGSGLGLYLARMIAEAHEGVIWAESEPGKGTEIKILFPEL
ncbi:MAG: GAF domain-containing sensor histidine kinase [Candidatus Goldbacteria bacterium]|nr:GAF domain-containing sensor histidine kinase [Candidatus Goldiibacteriota bacterium]